MLLQTYLPLSCPATQLCTCLHSFPDTITLTTTPAFPQLSRRGKALQLAVESAACVQHTVTHVCDCLASYSGLAGCKCGASAMASCRHKRAADPAAHDAMPCCRLLQRMLMDLHELRIVSGQALETWRYNWSDEEAIKDVSAWLVELKQSDEGTD